MSVSRRPAREWRLRRSTTWNKYYINTSSYISRCTTALGYTERMGVNFSRGGDVKGMTTNDTVVVVLQRSWKNEHSAVNEVSHETLTFPLQETRASLTCPTRAEQVRIWPNSLYMRKFDAHELNVETYVVVVVVYVIAFFPFRPDLIRTFSRTSVNPNLFLLLLYFSLN